MAVVLGGVLAKHEYKKFRISKDKNDDLEGLGELFTRRMKHLEWGVPDIIVLDGDERHIRVVEKVLGEMSLKQIQVVAVTKNKHHKASKLVGEKETLKNFHNEIIMSNAEAHRFSLSYHKFLRKKTFLT
jgi:excinuclease UvrABC nuclease subunit